MENTITIHSSSLYKNEDVQLQDYINLLKKNKELINKDYLNLDNNIEFIFEEDVSGISDGLLKYYKIINNNKILIAEIILQQSLTGEIRLEVNYYKDNESMGFESITDHTDDNNAVNYNIGEYDNWIKGLEIENEYKNNFI